MISPSCSPLDLSTPCLGTSLVHLTSIFSQTCYSAHHNFQKITYNPLTIPFSMFSHVSHYPQSPVEFDFHISYWLSKVCSCLHSLSKVPSPTFMLAEEQLAQLHKCPLILPTGPLSMSQTSCSSKSCPPYPKWCTYPKLHATCKW